MVTTGIKLPAHVDPISHPSRCQDPYAYIVHVYLIQQLAHISEYTRNNMVQIQIQREKQ